MAGDHPRGDANASNGDVNGRADRRTFLRRSAGVGAAAVGLGATAVGDVRAQEGTEEGGQEQTATGTAPPGEEETIAHKAALPADAPTLGAPDYVGLMVHISGVNQNASTRDVKSCPFATQEEAIVAYDATLIHADQVPPEPEGRREADTLLFAEVHNDAIAYGKLFIVQRQTICGSGHVQVQLEEIGAANFNTEGPEVAANQEEATETALPGFGVGGAIAGLLGGGELLRRRRSE